MSEAFTWIASDRADGDVSNMPLPVCKLTGEAGYHPSAWCRDVNLPSLPLPQGIDMTPCAGTRSVDV